MRIHALGAIFAIALSACTVAPLPMNTEFNETDFIPYLQKGSAQIIGSAFVKTMGGDVKLGAGNEVELAPATPYIIERLRRATINGENLAARDFRVSQYVRTTIADARGDFVFKDVPSGDYVLYCRIAWQVPFATYSTIETGGMAYARVTVRDGETVNVVVTR